MSKKHEHYIEQFDKVFIEFPESKLVEKRYHTIRYVLAKEYKEIINLVGKERMTDFIKDIIYCDRKLRELTEGEQDEEKEILSQEWKLKNGYEPTIKLKI